MRALNYDLFHRYFKRLLKKISKLQDLLFGRTM